LGHVHKRGIVSEVPCIVVPGNIQGRHIKENGSKGAVLVTVEDGRVVDVEERELDVLRWAICQVDLSECETSEAVHEQVRSAMEKAQGMTDGKTLALRLQLEGSCPLHAELHARSIQWTEELRGIAAGLGDVWLEKVKFRTSRKTSLEEIVGEDTPLSGLLQAVESLKFGDDVLTILVPELANLKTKLPAELLDADSILDISPEELTELREEVKELLIAKLIQHGGEA